MNTFFEKFKVSMALDRDRQSTKQNQPETSRPLEKSLRELDRNLRDSRAGGDVPPNLHGNIMRAVRTSTTRIEPAPSTILWPRLAAAALVLVAGVGVFWSQKQTPVKVEPPSSSEASASLAVAMEQGHALTQSAPAAAISPLSSELALLDGDIQKAVNFVVASVP